MQALKKAFWSFLLIAFLASCGGGGGGGNSSSSALLAFNPSTITANFREGTSATLNVRVTVTNPAAITGAIYVYVIDTQKLLGGTVNLTPIDVTTADMTLHTLSNLLAGRRQGSFQVQVCKDANCAVEYAGSPVALPYDLTVTPAPLAATPNSTTAGTVHWGGSIPNGVSVTVVGSGLDWTATTTASWLRVAGGTGKGGGVFSVSFAPQTMAVGNYADKVSVRSADGQVAEVPFTLTVLPTQFVLSAGVPTFSAINGSVIAANTLGFALDNSVASLWSATSTAPWLGLSPISGTTPAHIALQPDPTQGPLASGLHTATVILSSAGIANKTVTTSLTLIKPSWAATASSITLGGPKGRDLVTAQSLQASLNTGVNKWQFSLSTLPAWLSTTAPLGSVNQLGTTLTFSPIAANVSPGAVSAAVMVAAQVNGDKVVLPITVNLNADQRKLLVSQSGIGFASTPLGTVLTRTIKVSDNFGGSLPWTATSDSAWLSVTSSGTAGSVSNVIFTANPASLPSGTMSYANVTLSSVVTGIKPAVVRVGLWKDTTGVTAITKLPLDYATLIADKIRPFVYANNGGTTVDIFHAYTAQKLGTIANAGAAVGGMTVSPDGSRLYVVDTAAKSLAVIDLKTASKVATWSLVNAVTRFTSVLAIAPNGVEVVLLGDGTAYTQGRSLGATRIFGTLAASADGRKVYAHDSGSSPSGFAAFDVDYSDMSGGVLMSTVVGTGGAGSNGQDIAVSNDASALYLASGSPYTCSSMSPTSYALIGSLPGGDAYPNNVEVTSDGRAICGIQGWYAAADFWVHSPAGALLSSYKVAGYAKALKARQMVVTPDGLVVVTLTDDPLMAFVPIGP